MSLFVDDEGLGRAGGAISEVRLLGIVADDRHVREVIVDDILAISRVIGIEAHGQYDEIGDLSLKLHKGREFLLTGRTPGGPEVQYHNFAAILIEAYSLCAIVDGEAGCGLVDQSGVRAAIAACGEAAEKYEGAKGCYVSTAHVSIIEGNHRECFF